MALQKSCFRSAFLMNSTKTWTADQITVRVLENKYINYANGKNQLVTGRAMFDLAKVVLKNCKKAWSCAKPYLDKDGNPAESGKTLEDVLKIVRDKMYKLLKEKPEKPEQDDDDEEESAAAPTKKQKAENSSDKETQSEATPPPSLHQDSQTDSEADAEADDYSDNEEGAPPEWIFHGYVAFVYFAPFSINRVAGRSLDFFLASDPAPDRKKQYGRKAVRAQRAKEEQEERNRDATRGKSAVERLLMENQSHQKLMAKQAGYEATLMSLNLRADRLQKRATLALEAAKATSNYERYDRLEHELDEINKEIKAVEDKMNKTLEDDGKTAETAVQVL